MRAAVACISSAARQAFDWMLETGLGHAADRHIGVADRLNFLQSAAGYDVVERGEILVEKTDKRRRFGAFG